MNNLIDETLSKISKEYHSGLIEYLQQNLVYWPKVLTIEARVNHAALEGDRKGLIRVLDEYEDLFEEATRGNAVAVPVRDIRQIKPREEVKDMRHHDRFIPNFLGQKDIEKPRTLTIESFGMEEIKTENGPVEKYVLRFEEIEDRGFVVNSINSQLLEALYGDDEDWIGKRIEVFTDPTISFGNKVTGGLRLRRPSQPAPQEETPF
jgi:hypothetical protein